MRDLNQEFKIPTQTLATTLVLVHTYKQLFVTFSCDCDLADTCFVYCLLFTRYSTNLAFCQC